MGEEACSLAEIGKVVEGCHGNWAFVKVGQMKESSGIETIRNSRKEGRHSCDACVNAAYLGRI